ncbi:AfsA-related hotdog domain-containing protein [Streptomyces sp. NPDC004284]|uniref:AfsA-related hotdog domain-containing protein n=1 Tax=Streptomyces sp. NPDC004284 TaxID=3364695 RepID=UPI00368732F2
MTVTTGVADVRPRPEELRYVQTVDRSMVHRDALSEVFLTDSQQIAPDRYLAAAQLPPTHAYYTDHLLSGLPDPLLLLESCRQAETYGGHAYFGVPRDTKFILRSWRVGFPGLLAARGTAGPAPLVMDVTTLGRRGPAGRLRALTYASDVQLAGHHLGDVRIDVGYLGSESYTQLRADQRGGTPPPSSTALRATPPGLAPDLVGRTQRANVVLDTVHLKTGGATATVRLPVDHPSMFDHAQDHLPGMVLMEAARQLALVAGRHHHGTLPTRTTVAGFAFEFSRYAELDAPVTARLRSGLPADAVLADTLPEVHTYAVEFLQHGAVIAQGEISTATLTAAAEIRA